MSTSRTFGAPSGGVGCPIRFHVLALGRVARHAELFGDLLHAQVGRQVVEQAQLGRGETRDGRRRSGGQLPSRLLQASSRALRWLGARLCREAWRAWAAKSAAADGSPRVSAVSPRRMLQNSAVRGQVAQSGASSPLGGHPCVRAAACSPLRARPERGDRVHGDGNEHAVEPMHLGDLEQRGSRAWWLRRGRPARGGGWPGAAEDTGLEQWGLRDGPARRLEAGLGQTPGRPAWPGRCPGSSSPRPTTDSSSRRPGRADDLGVADDPVEAVDARDGRTSAAATADGGAPLAPATSVASRSAAAVVRRTNSGVTYGERDTRPTRRQLSALGRWSSRPRSSTQVRSRSTSPSLTRP